MYNAAHSPKPADVLVADIGSTLTKRSAFTGVRNVGGLPLRQALCFVGQGMALTTVDEVVIIGRQGHEEVTAGELAAKLGSTNYEIVTQIATRVPRLAIHAELA